MSASSIEEADKCPARIWWSRIFPGTQCSLASICFQSGISLYISLLISRRQSESTNLIFPANAVAVLYVWAYNQNTGWQATAFLPSTRVADRRVSEVNTGLKRIPQRLRSTSYLDLYSSFYTKGGRDATQFADSVHLNDRGMLTRLALEISHLNQVMPGVAPRIGQFSGPLAHDFTLS